MKLIIQYVSHASVTSNNLIKSINRGYVCLVGFTLTDDHKTIEKMTNKLLNLRIIPDKFGKINESIMDSKGEILLIPQFTLYASTKKGHRPSFSQAASPNQARLLFDKFAELLQQQTSSVKTGFFKTHMNIIIHNDGPLTFTLEV